MKRKNHWWIVLVCYVAVIWGNSLTPASVSSQESGFLLRMLQRLFAGADISLLWLTEHMIRKAAHFTEYAGLGFLLIKSMPYSVRTAAELGAVIPLIDETIQLFVAGRSGQISDVWLDMCGAAAGMAVTLAFRGRKR
jgi:VanZ family protein